MDISESPFWVSWVGALTLVQAGYWMIYLCGKIVPFEGISFFRGARSLLLCFFVGQAIFVIFYLATGLFFSFFPGPVLLLFSLFLLPFTSKRLVGWAKNFREWKVDFIREDFAALILILLLSFPASIYSLYHPLLDGDSRSIWFFHGKYFYYSGSIPRAFFQNSAYHFSHLDYPPFIPLLSVFFSTIADGWNEVVCKSFLYWNWLGAMLVLYFIFVEEGVHRWIALIFIGTFSHVMTNQGVNGDADVHMAFYFFCASYFFCFYLRDQEKGRGALCYGVFFAMGAALLKNEGALYTVLLLCYSTIFMRKGQGGGKRRNVFLPVSIVVLIPAFVWYGAVYLNGVRGDMAVFNILSRYSWRHILFERIPLILDYYQNPRSALAEDGGFFFVWSLLFFLSTLAVTIMRRRELPFLMVRMAHFILGLQLIMIAVYINTPNDLKWHLHTSFTRVAIPSLLLLLLFNGLTLSALLKFQLSKKPENH